MASFYLHFFSEMVLTSHSIPACRPINRTQGFTVHLTLLCDCGACLNGPSAVLHFHKSKGVHDLLSFESELEILLVGKHEERNVLKTFLDKQALELLCALLQAHFI